MGSAISLWGDADQQSTYLPPFTEDDVPAAALAIQEPRVLFDPLELETVATRGPDGVDAHGAKSLVLRAAEAELFVVAARIEGEGPALFIIESGTEGLTVEAEPAMGVRAAATGTLRLDGVAVGPEALLGGADPAVYTECVQRSRIAWAALALAPVARSWTT